MQHGSAATAAGRGLLALRPSAGRLDTARGQRCDGVDGVLLGMSAGEISTDAAYRYCQRIARERARTFYYGSRFLPPAKRRASWALYAFCRTADDIADEPHQCAESVHELARWREALLATYAGQPRGPIMTAWADMLHRFRVPVEPALELLDGVTMDLRGVRFETWDELRLYCYRVAGTVGLLMAPMLGCEREEASPSAIDLGIAMQLTNILRDVGEDAARGRVYLPVEEMERFGYREDQLRAGDVTPAFRVLMELQITRAEEHYARGMAGIRLLDGDARLAIGLSATLYRAILGRIRRNGYDVFTRRAHVPLAGKLAAVPGVWLGLQRAGRHSEVKNRTTPRVSVEY